jgi:hypothetical protein
MRVTMMVLVMMAGGCSNKEQTSLSDVSAGSDSDSDTVVTVDGGANSDTVATVDGGTDRDIDVNIFTDTDEEMDDWSHCPETSVYEGDTGWAHALDVSASAVYCAMFNEERTLEEELAVKAKLRLVEGEYPIPNATGIFDFALPVCVIFSGGDTAVTTSAGMLETSVSSDEEVVVTHRFAFAVGDDRSLYGYLSYTAPPGISMEPIALDGTQYSIYHFNNAIYLALCEAGVAECIDNLQSNSLLTFVSCNPTEFTLERHTFVFDGGDVSFDFRMANRGEWMSGGTEPGALVRAVGELDSVPFAQDEYWKLIYSPLHHHFGRDFSVLFDTPIGTACGIKVEAKYDDPVVHTVACNLANIEARMFVDYLFDILEE